MNDQVFQILLVYLDDAIVFSQTFDEHLERLDRVFTKLGQHGLKIKPQKCTFRSDRVSYLGHVVSASSVETNPAKASTAKDWARPQTVKELCSFLGFCSYYRCFVKDFAKVAGPLHELQNHCLHELKTWKKLQPPLLKQWTVECQTTLDQLKSLLTSTPVLGYADFTKPFVLETDASNQGLGAVLSQDDQDGKPRVIAYASRQLRPAEKNMDNYSLMKLELLALKWAVTEKFRSYLIGSEFKVFTDNNPLKHLDTAS